MRIELAPDELEFAALAGVLRHGGALVNGVPDRYGMNGDGWGVHIGGVAAELAVAKHRDRFYLPALHVQRDGEADVGPFHVRSTPRDDGCLILHRGDPDDAVFVLVVGVAPALDVVGWLKGAEGKRPEFWRSGGVRHPAFFVPQSALRRFPDRRS